MSVNPHVLQYLDGKLAATGSQALPYDEWSKPALRDQLLQLVEVRPPVNPKTSVPSTSPRSPRATHRAPSPRLCLPVRFVRRPRSTTRRGTPR